MPDPTDKKPAGGVDATTGAQPETDPKKPPGKPTKQKDNGRFVDTPTVRTVLPPEAGGPKRVKWDDSEMRTTYANVCNVASTREEFTLLFGTNQTWNVQPGGAVQVRLSDRVILSPFAAKRLAMLINSVVAEYEKRFGPLRIDSP